MVVKTKLQRLGKIRTTQYHVITTDARTCRDSAVIKNLGIYHPKEEPSTVKTDFERVQYWLDAGTQPTRPVLALLKVTDGWQKFKNPEGTEGTLKVAGPKPAKPELFNKAPKEANDGLSAEAITVKYREAKEAVKATKGAEKTVKVAGAKAAKSEVSEDAEQ